MSADAHRIPETVGGAAAGPPAGSRKVSIEERRRLVAESLRIGNPGNHARDLPTDTDPRHECQIELRVTDIRPYEHNPRRAGNAKFAEIKESIRAAGIRAPLTVTRRPGETHFIIESGGNTRLLAVQQLWVETGEARFEKLSVLFRPWRSESHVLTAHMVENEQRGEMTFWDRATGVIAIKANLEAENGNVFSLRQLEAALKAMGLATNPTSLSHYLFVTERLRALAESIPHLSAQDIKIILPRLNTLKRQAQARADIAEEKLYASIFDPAIRQAADCYRRGEGFSAKQLCDACEAALARHLGQPVAELRRDIDALSRPGQDGAREIRREHVTSMAPARVRVPASAPLQDAALAQGNPAAVNGVDSRSVRAALTAPPPPGEALPDDPREGREYTSIMELARRLAQRAGIETHVRFDPMAPLGFRAIEQPTESQDLQPGALRVSWLLSLLVCTQSATGNVRILGESGGRSVPAKPCGPDANKSSRIQTGAAGLLDWLLAPDDALAGATLEFVGRLREWRISRSSCRSAAEIPPSSMKDA